MSDYPRADRNEPTIKDDVKRIYFPHVDREVPGIPEESYATQHIFEAVKNLAGRLEEYDRYRGQLQEHIDHYERILKWVDNERSHLMEFLKKAEPSEKSSNSYDH